MASQPRQPGDLERSATEDVALEPSQESQVRRFADADYAYCRGELDVAFAMYTQLLREGCIEATLGLAEMYLRGEGVEANVDKGLELLKQAVVAGSPTAAFNLGALHRSGGCRVPVDSTESRRYFLLARELGCPIPVDDWLR